MSEAFGSMLRQLRRSSGISQSDLAEKLNVAQQTITKWENSYREPSFDMLCVIADMFGVSLDMLLGRDTPATPFVQMSTKENQLIDTYRSLNHQGKNALLTTASIIAGNPDMQKENRKAEAG